MSDTDRFTPMSLDALSKEFGVPTAKLKKFLDEQRPGLRVMKPQGLDIEIYDRNQVANILARNVQ